MRVSSTSTKMIRGFMAQAYRWPACRRWPEYGRIYIPVLCLRGAESDLLLADTAEQMRDRGPRALVVTIAGCGHAPALNVPEQLLLVSRFLAGQ